MAWDLGRFRQHIEFPSIEELMGEEVPEINKSRQEMAALGKVVSRVTDGKQKVTVAPERRSLSAERSGVPSESKESLKRARAVEVPEMSEPQEEGAASGKVVTKVTDEQKKVTVAPGRRTPAKERSGVPSEPKETRDRVVMRRHDEWRNRPW